MRMFMWIPVILITENYQQKLTTTDSLPTSTDKYWWRSFSAPRARPAQPFFFAAPGGPKLARPLASAIIGHAHLPRFSYLQMASASEVEGKMIIVS